MEKSANKRWKESGTVLSFKEWIDRDNKKSQSSENSSFLPFVGNKPDVSIIQDTIQASIGTLPSNYKPDETHNTVLGLNKGVLIFSTFLIVGSLGFYFYSKYKKNNG